MYQLTPEQLAAYIEYLTRGYSGQPLWSRKLDDMGTAVRVLQILLGVPITSPSPNVQVNGTGSPAVEDNVKTSGTNVTPVKTSATPAVTPVKRESAKKARTISTRGRHRS
jgi:hypothetical protein